MQMNSNTDSKRLQYVPETTTASDFLSQQKQSLEKIGQKSIDLCGKRRGDLAEDDVIRTAALQGAEVFKNHYTTGPADLVLMDLTRTPALVAIDVKSTVKKSKGDKYGHGDKGRPHKEGVINVSYHVKTGEARWLKGYVPKGWEDFWDETIS